MALGWSESVVDSVLRASMGENLKPAVAETLFPYRRCVR